MEILQHKQIDSSYHGQECHSSFSCLIGNRGRTFHKKSNRILLSMLFLQAVVYKKLFKTVHFFYKKRFYKKMRLKSSKS